MGHTPFSYRIENGKAVIDDAAAAQVRELYKNYLSGLSLTNAAKEAGLKLRVAAYCRVSTDSDEQATSYDAQVEHYTELIQKNPEWEFAGIYADDGISGTNTKKREDFNRMIEDCEAGNIDMIITKSISRFARNTLDCLKYIRKLKDKLIQ